MSQPRVVVRRLRPRWSRALTGGVWQVVASAAAMAGLCGWRLAVSVGPPLLVTGLRPGLAMPTWSPLLPSVRPPQPVGSPSRLCPPGPSSSRPAQSGAPPAEVLAAMMVLLARIGLAELVGLAGT